MRCVIRMLLLLIMVRLLIGLSKYLFLVRLTFFLLLTTFLKGYVLFQCFQVRQQRDRNDEPYFEDQRTVPSTSRSHTNWVGWKHWNWSHAAFLKWYKVSIKNEQYKVSQCLKSVQSNMLPNRVMATNVDYCKLFNLTQVPMATQLKDLPYVRHLGSDRRGRNTRRSRRHSKICSTHEYTCGKLPTTYLIIIFSVFNVNTLIIFFCFL